MLEVYPLGRVQFPAAFDSGRVAEAIAELERLPGELAESVAGCADLDHVIRQDAWSIHALVHHVADSHMNAYIRTKLALTEDDPVVKAYDEVAWSRLADSRMPVEVSLELTALLHRRWTELLRHTTPQEMERGWVAPMAAEPRPLWRLPLTYAWHGAHHVAQILQARRHFGI